MLSISAILGEKGLLQEVIEGFTPRDEQQNMAEAIQRSLDSKAPFIIEAGTGIGKTFGYLVPLFINKTKAIISTGTKNLQDQLFFKDIPCIQNLFPGAHSIVLLKGRANYLCKLRLKRQLEEGLLSSTKYITQLQNINAWAQETVTGDISEVTTVPEDSHFWREVTSTTDNCLGQACEFYQKCFVVKARKKAMAANIIIVNHHLFFADIALQDNGFGELLPGVEAIIFDEAHHLPDIASHFFSTTLSSRQLIELARDSALEISTHAKDMLDELENTKQVEYHVQELRAAFGMELKKASWPESLPSHLKTWIEEVKKSLANLERILKLMAPRHKSLEACWRRALTLIEKFHILTQPAPENIIHWYEIHLHSFVLQHTPLIVADQFKQYLQADKRSWVFTSATLTVKNSFKLFVDALGLQNAQILQLKSPFDYERQALLYVPRALPDVHTAHYIDHLVNAILPVLELSKGKAFLLFTSYKAMEKAYKLLHNKVAYPLLLQGTLPKRQLISTFKNKGNAILLATGSFWQGVDVRGEALSCVIIDKLPFSAPDDPILLARIQMLRKQGYDPFEYYQLPQAVIALKQGAGRLIRDSQDRGILVICDPRIVGSRYGETFLLSLPKMPRTRDINKVINFFNVL